MTAFSIFPTLPLTFDRVSTDGGIDTKQFLAASDGLVQLLETTLKGPAFSSFVKGIKNCNDIISLEHTTVGSPTSSTLQRLVANEGNPGEPATDRGASLGLLVLMRNLRFLADGFRNSLMQPKEELKESFKRSYDTSLKKHHGFVVRTMVAAALKTTPSKAESYKQVGSADQRQLEGELDAYTRGLEKIAAELEAFFSSGNWASGLEK